MEDNCKRGEGLTPNSIQTKSEGIEVWEWPAGENPEGH